MTAEGLGRDVSERLAHLWNCRHRLAKPEWIEFYELLTRRVWVRANVRSLCDELLIEPRDAFHGCFVDKILTPARSGRGNAATLVEPEAIVGYLMRILRHYLIEQLRRQDVDRGGNQVINLDEDQWLHLIDGATAGTADHEVLDLSTGFQEWIRNEALPSAQTFIRQLDRDDLILLKCWYGCRPQPALYWFARIMPNPDYRARRLGINPCTRDFLDFGRTRIGKWAGGFGVSLARNRYSEIHVVLEMLKVLASREQAVDCAALDIGPPPARAREPAAGQ
jgi:hypothetical protein